MGQYSKFYVALAGAVVAFVTSLYGGSNSYVQLLVATLTAVGVYATANTSQTPRI